MRDVNNGLWRSGEVGCIQDDEIRRVVCHVHDITHQPAIIFCTRIRLWHEDELARDLAGTEIMRFACTGFKIMLVQRRVREELVTAAKFLLGE